MFKRAMGGKPWSSAVSPGAPPKLFCSAGDGSFAELTSRQPWARQALRGDWGARSSTPNGVTDGSTFTSRRRLSVAPVSTCYRIALNQRGGRPVRMDKRRIAADANQHRGDRRGAISKRRRPAPISSSAGRWRRGIIPIRRAVMCLRNDGRAVTDVTNEVCPERRKPTRLVTDAVGLDCRRRTGA